MDNTEKIALARQLAQDAQQWHADQLDALNAYLEVIETIMKWEEGTPSEQAL